MRGQSPERHTVICHYNAHSTRYEQGDDRHDSQFPLLHLSEQDGTRHNAERGNEEADKEVAREGREDGFVEEVSDEGCAAKEEEIKKEAHADVEPENGVVVVMSGIAFVGQCCHESAVLQ